MKADESADCAVLCLACLKKIRFGTLGLRGMAGRLESKAVK
jgi:hypothetical protein